EARLGAAVLRVDTPLAVDDVAVEGVLDVRAAATGASAEDALGVRLVVGEQQLAGVRPGEEVRAEVVGAQEVAQRRRAVRVQAAPAGTRGAGFDHRTGRGIRTP